MEKENIVLFVRKQLRDNADEKTKRSFQRLFKAEMKFYGVKSVAVKKIAKESFAKIKTLGKEKIFALCEEFLRSDYCEEAWIAANWAYWVRKEYVTLDIEVFEQWIEKYIDNWAKCDTFCNHAVGYLVERFPQHLDRLKKWTQSSNRWLKRAAAVSLIIPTKEGKFLGDVFEIADKLLSDKDDMVQKGYGWMLKEASRKHQKEVFGYVLDHKHNMPRTALRYAIEKMPLEMREKAIGRV